MAVAVKEAIGSTSSRPVSRLALGTLAGTLYLWISLAIIFYGVQYLWGMLVSPNMTAPAVNTALRILATLAAIAGLVWGGKRLLGTHPVRGLRAGVFLGFVALLLILLVTTAVGNALEARIGESNPPLGMGITAITAVVLLGLAAWSLFRPGFDLFALQFEDQGWFTSSSYKRGQGLRVRRGTLLGILILCGCGIYTLLAHDTLRSGNPNWEVILPFAGGYRLSLLPDIQFSVPILIAAASLWLGYRVVNYPVFADFLIATEAELNKVSWTTRRRLIQDTLVVLVTVFLLTTFMFGVDIVWVKILSSPWIQVLQTGGETEKTQTGPLDW
jgi:preprotein translocase SecE subunit